MNFNAQKAKNSATSTGAVVGGMILGHSVSKIVREKAPESLAKYADYASGFIALAAIATPAFVTVKNDLISDVLTGVAAAGALAQLNSFTKVDGVQATDGMKGMMAKYLPNLGSVELPSYTYYQEPAQSLLEAGNYQESTVPATNFFGSIGSTGNAVQNLLVA